MNLQDSTNWDPRPFRSISAWFSNPSFKAFVTIEWRKLERWEVNKKLRLLKEPIRIWNREVFDHIHGQVKKLEVEIDFLQQAG